MKLLLCPQCQDVIKLQTTVVRKCLCGHVQGYYEKDGLNAVVSKHAIILGFDNRSLLAALHVQPNPHKGTSFNAFIISPQARTIKIMDE